MIVVLFEELQHTVIMSFELPYLVVSFELGNTLFATNSRIVRLQVLYMRLIDRSIAEMQRQLGLITHLSKGNSET